MNSRPLSYQGEEFEKPVIAANLLVKGQPANFLDEDVEELDEKTAVAKRIRYLKTCREHLKKRGWLTEYVHKVFNGDYIFIYIFIPSRHVVILCNVHAGGKGSRNPWNSIINIGGHFTGCSKFM